MIKRVPALALTAVGAVLLQACAYSDLGNYCSHSASQSLAKVDSDTLGVILGAPAGRVIDAPFVMLYSPSMESQEAAVRIDLVPAAIPWPSALDESRCRGVDWRTYRVTTDPEKWQAFWSRPRPFAIEFHVGFTDSYAPLPKRSFALAWVDTATAEPIMSCGCYEA